MLTDWELWAVANQTLEERGEDASGFAASRIEALALAGNAAGVVVWKEIARRVAELRAGPPEKLHS